MFVRRAAAEDRVVLERLWLLFRHDMSEFQGQLPRPDGSYRTGDVWTSERRLISGKPDATPDVWISFQNTTTERSTSP